MKKFCRALKDRVERCTGVIWGTYRAPETFCGTDIQQPPFWLIVSDKASGFVRFDCGVRRGAFCLSWGER